MQKENFYLKFDEPLKSCFLAMQQLVLNTDSIIEETVKYGMPCFVYKGKAFCYLWYDKKTNEPYFLMVEGNLLTHTKLETGNRARMKILRLNPSKDLPVKTIAAVLNEALDLYRLGKVLVRKK